MVGGMGAGDMHGHKYNDVWGVKSECYDNIYC